jgi:hypothetical protein
MLSKGGTAAPTAEIPEARHLSRFILAVAITEVNERFACLQQLQDCPRILDYSQHRVGEQC